MREQREAHQEPIADQLVSFWIEFAEWPDELRFHHLPPYPRECGVTGADLSDALNLIHRGFYESRELAPVLRVEREVDRAAGEWAEEGETP